MKKTKIKRPESVPISLRLGSLRILLLFYLLMSVTLLRAEENLLSKRVTVVCNKATLPQYIESLRNQVHCQFIIDALEAQLIKEISLNQKSVTLKESLDSVLKEESGLTYVLANNTIVIRQKAEQYKSAQQVFPVNGLITNKKGAPLFAVNVRIAGLNVGTITNEKGSFSINSPKPEGFLEITYVGFKPQKVAFKGNVPLIIRLEEKTFEIGEIQAVAYGTQSKREVTGSISNITAKQLQDLPSSNVINLLQGKVSGMSVINTSGSLGGGGSTVTIRGFNSLSIDGERRLSDPLWVIDGVPVPNFTSPVTGTNGLADLDPNSIESIEVLKDAASASIYGSRAANGVIMVTTKKGKIGKSILSVNYSSGWSFNPIMPSVTGGAAERRFRLLQMRNFVQGYRYTGTDNLYHYKNPTSYDEVYGTANAGGQYDLFWNRGMGLDQPAVQDSLNSFYNNSTNWFNEFLQVGKVDDVNLQAGGGNDFVQYHLGVGYYHETGVLKGTDFSRINLSGNYTLRPVKGAVIDSRIYLAYTDRAKSRDSYPGVELMDINPYTISTLLPAAGSPVFEQAMSNLKGIKETNEDYKVRSNNTISYEILKDLKVSTSAGIDFWQNMMDYFRPSYLGTENPVRPKESYVSGTIGRYLLLLNENLITYKKEIGRHKLDFLLGQSSQVEQFNRVMGSATGGPSDFIHYATAGFPTTGYMDDGVTPRQMQAFQSDMTKKALSSWFGRFNYVYNGKYLMSLTYRRDGSSTFGDNNKWGTFPSASIGWVFSEEGFMKNFTPLYFGKIRASVGKSGMQFSQPYLAYGVFVPSTDDFLGQSILTPEWKEGAPNPSLKWEETTQYDAGLDLQLFNRKINVTADYYNRITKGMLVPLTLPGSYSYNPYQSQWQNGASVSNSGLEFKIEADIVRNEKLVWEFSFNIARNWNKFNNSVGRRDFSSSSSNISIVGESLNQLYVYKYKGIYQSDAEVPVYNYVKPRYEYTLSGSVESMIYRAGDPIYEDINQDGKITSADRVTAGSPLPTVVGGFVNTIKWKNFDLNVLFAYTLGRRILDASLGKSFTLDVQDPMMGVHTSHPILADLSDYSFWSPENTSGTMPMVQADPGRKVFSNASTRDVKKVNYMKLKSLALGYTLPKFKIAPRVGIRFFVSGENLWTITDYKGRDPETIDLVTGIDGAEAYPLATKLICGLTVNF